MYIACMRETLILNENLFDNHFFKYSQIVSTKLKIEQKIWITKTITDKPLPS